jgi:hypothetical protein
MPVAANLSLWARSTVAHRARCILHARNMIRVASASLEARPSSVKLRADTNARRGGTAAWTRSPTCSHMQSMHQAYTPGRFQEHELQPQDLLRRIERTCSQHQLFLSLFRRQSGDQHVGGSIIAIDAPGNWKLFSRVITVVKRWWILQYCRI